MTRTLTTAAFPRLAAAVFAAALACVTAPIAAVAPIIAAPIAAAAPPLSRWVRVPLDHQAPGAGSDSIYVEIGAPLDRTKPLVFVIADGQQFYVRPGAMARMSREEFGGECNLVGIVGRGSSPGIIAAARRADGSTDWKRAWTLFRAEQWVEDIEAVRRDMFGDTTRIALYAASGGSLLALQYLARHGERVSRAFLASPFEPFLVGELGLSTDHFWEELGAQDSSLRVLLGRALGRYAKQRPALVMTLQRQNFFVPPESLAAARAGLIRALAAGDDLRFATARKAYQVEEVSAFFDSPEGIPVRVREFELFHPAGGRRLLGTDALRPDLENQYTFARPLVALCDSGAIPAPALDRGAFHRLGAQVFLLAGRRDHTVDYRSAIALWASFPKGLLFMADDDHVFAHLKASGDYDRLLRAFLAAGADSPRLRQALATAAPRRWVER